ncbi:MAG: hypothetical protein O2782_03805 [bacterium]|nr:hypothetical protein [bacterium]
MTRPNSDAFRIVATEDNVGLEPLVGPGFSIGFVLEVNGADSEEVRFTPTRHELKQLVRMWLPESFSQRREWVFWGQYCSVGSRLSNYAENRLCRIADALGEKEYGQVFDEAIEAYGREMDATSWDIFLSGSEGEIKVQPQADEFGPYPSKVEECRSLLRILNSQQKQNSKEIQRELGWDYRYTWGIALECLNHGISVKFDPICAHDTTEEVTYERIHGDDEEQAWVQQLGAMAKRLEASETVNNRATGRRVLASIEGFLDLRPRLRSRLSAG